MQPTSQSRKNNESVWLPPEWRHTPMLLSSRQVMEITGFSYIQIRTRMAKGKFPPAGKIGIRKLFWVSTDLHKWISEKLRS